MAKNYRVQAKVKDRGASEFKLVTYNTDNLLSFVKFLEVKFEKWNYLNVYEYIKHTKGPLLESFSCKNPPRTKTLQR